MLNRSAFFSLVDQLPRAVFTDLIRTTDDAVNNATKNLMRLSNYAQLDVHEMERYLEIHSHCNGTETVVRLLGVPMVVTAATSPFNFVLNLLRDQLAQMHQTKQKLMDHLKTGKIKNLRDLRKSYVDATFLSYCNGVLKFGPTNARKKMMGEREVTNEAEVDEALGVKSAVSELSFLAKSAILIALAETLITTFPGNWGYQKSLNRKVKFRNTKDIATFGTLGYLERTLRNVIMVFGFIAGQPFEAELKKRLPGHEKDWSIRIIPAAVLALIVTSLATPPDVVWSTRQSHMKDNFKTISHYDAIKGIHKAHGWKGFFSGITCAFPATVAALTAFTWAEDKIDEEFSKKRNRHSDLTDWEPQAFQTLAKLNFWSASRASKLDSYCDESKSIFRPL